MYQHQQYLKHQLSNKTMDTKTPIQPSITPPVDPMNSLPVPPPVSEAPIVPTAPSEPQPIDPQPIQPKVEESQTPVSSPLETTTAETETDAAAPIAPHSPEVTPVTETPAEEKKEAVAPVVPVTPEPTAPMQTMEAAIPGVSVPPSVDAPVYPPASEPHGNKKVMTIVLSIVLLAVIGIGGVVVYGMMMKAVPPVITAVTKDITPTVEVTPAVTAAPTPANAVDEVNSINVTDPSTDLNTMDQSAASL
jgi:hypothetical protein